MPEHTRYQIFMLATMVLGLWALLDDPERFPWLIFLAYFLHTAIELGRQKMQKLGL